MPLTSRSHFRKRSKGFAMMFFIDESGHDHGEAPYEVLAAIAVCERDLWNLIQAIRNAEVEFFGIHFGEVGVEFKGKKLLKAKTFRHSHQGPQLDAENRRNLVRAFLQKGWHEAQGGPIQPRSKDEFTAYGQAVTAFVLRVLKLCAQFRVKTFAAMVTKSARQSATPRRLRRDYAFLFERFFYYLEDFSATEMGLVVFDELEKAKSNILIHQMEHYFLETERGYQRSARIVPEPFFVHSDLTTAVQIADIVAYCFNWGLRLNRMTEPTRTEIEPFAKLAKDLRYEGFRPTEDGQSERHHYGVFYLDDLRPKWERENQREE